MPSLLHRAVAEFIGTFAIVFAGCGSIVIASVFPGALAQGAIPIVFGVTVTCMIYSVGHISGAHFNPAVTLAFALGRHFPKNEILVYWLAQFLSAIAAISILASMFPGVSDFGVTKMNIGVGSAFLTETILSFLLMFVIISVATDTRAEGTMAGVAIGGMVAVCAFIGGPITGASMNPARSLAPALFGGNLSTLWIYFAGPITGMILAAFVYEWIRSDATFIRKS